MLQATLGAADAHFGPFQGEADQNACYTNAVAATASVALDPEGHDERTDDLDRSIRTDLQAASQ